MMTKEEAIERARLLTGKTLRKHHVRDDHGQYTICPTYMPGREGQEVDGGQQAFGVLVAGTHPCP